MDKLVEIADLLKRRRQIGEKISRIIGRPALPSHIGEFIASKIFSVKLETSATAK